jgi:hypothetical protein
MPFDVGRFTEEIKPLQTHPAELSLVMLSLFALVVFGSYALMDLNVLGLFLNISMEPMALALLPLALAFLGLAAVYVFLYAVHITGLEGFIQLMGLVSLLVIVPLIFLLPSFGIILVPLVVMGILVLLSIWHGTNEARIRAERFLAMTSRIMVEEKELVLPMVAFLLISVYLLLTYLGVTVSLGWVKVSGSVARGYSVSFMDPISIGISLPFFIFLHFVFHSLFMGAAAGVTYIWHRGEDPKMMHGINLIAHRLDAMLPYSYQSSINRAISSIAGEPFHNPFILQAVAITGKRPQEAEKISLKVLKNLPGVLFKELFQENGSEFVYRIFRDIILFAGIVTFIVSGSFIWALTVFYAAGTVFSLTLATMGVVYQTLLFSFALERELGVKDPGRMPDEMAPVINRILQVDASMGGVESHIKQLDGGA